MKRWILMSAALAGGSAMAADTPPSAPKWNPPATVWRDPTRATPIAQFPTPPPDSSAPDTKSQSVPLGSPLAVPNMGIPAQSAPQAGPATAPLTDLLNTPLPTSPSVVPTYFGPAIAPGGTPGCATGDCGPAARGSCLARAKNWLCFQPGPPVLPTCQPARYQVPLRYYFPCVGGAGCGANGCGANGCGANGLGANGNAAGGCAPGVGAGLAQPARPLSNLGANLGANFNNLRGLVTPAGHGGGYPAGGTGGVLGPIAGGCGTPGIIQGGPLAGLHPDFGTGCDGCVNIKHKGLGACAEPSCAAPVTGPICLTTQAVGVPLPASCVGSPTSYTGCYAGCDTAGSACRAGAGGRLLGLVFGTCHGGCSQVAEGGNGFAPTSIVPVVVGYARPRANNYRFADPLSNVTGTPAIPGVPNPEIGQPRVDTVGPNLMQSGYTNPAKPFTRQ